MDDCPVIAIDSFKHMYLFPDFSMVHQEGRLLQFVKDLHSGKLHREFHQGPGNKIFRSRLFMCVNRSPPRHVSSIGEEQIIFFYPFQEP